MLVDGAIKNVFSGLEQLYNGLSAEYPGSDSIRLPPDFESITEFFGGFPGGSLVAVCGRPEIGKSSLLLNIALTSQTESALAYFAASDWTEKDVTERLLSMAAYETSELTRGQLSEREWARVVKQAGRLSEADLWLDASCDSVEAVARTVRRLKKKSSLDAILIDDAHYLGRDDLSRREAMDHVCRDLKALARELGVPVVFTVPLLSSQAQHSETLEDLGEYEKVEQYADSVLLLRSTKGLESHVELVLAQNNRGPYGERLRTQLGFAAAVGRFISVEEGL